MYVHGANFDNLKKEVRNKTFESHFKGEEAKGVRLSKLAKLSKRGNELGKKFVFTEMIFFFRSTEFCLSG